MKLGVILGTLPKIIKMCPILDFLSLEANAKLILVDSRKLQEDSCILNALCATLRNNAERPKIPAVGSNILVSTDPFRILECMNTMLSNKNKWSNPFGDGTSSKRMLSIVGREVL